MNYNDSLVFEGKQAKALWRERDSNPRHCLTQYTCLADKYSILDKTSSPLKTYALLCLNIPICDMIHGHFMDIIKKAKKISAYYKFTISVTTLRCIFKIGIWQNRIICPQ